MFSSGSRQEAPGCAVSSPEGAGFVCLGFFLFYLPLYNSTQNTAGAPQRRTPLQIVCAPAPVRIRRPSSIKRRPESLDIKHRSSSHSRSLVLPPSLAVPRTCMSSSPAPSNSRNSCRDACRVQRWRGEDSRVSTSPCPESRAGGVRGGGPNRSWPSGLLAVTSHS